MNKELSVIVPAYNEEAKIAATLENIAAYLRTKGYRFEVVVVNDGSTDGTVSQVHSISQKFPEILLIDRRQNVGKGRTVKEGMAAARYEYCLFMDADDSTSIVEWDKFEPLFEAGQKVVVASRHLQGSRILHPQPWTRRFLGGGYRVICRGLLGLKASDFNCGFKAYRREVAQSIYPGVQMTDWTFDVEVFCALKRKGIAFAEVPVAWSHSSKKSGLPPVRTAFRSLQSLARLQRLYGS